MLGPSAGAPSAAESVVYDRARAPRIALDAFGSDRRPHEELGATLLAAKAGIGLDLVGARDRLEPALLAEGLERDALDDLVRIVDARDEIAMDESPARAVRSKPDASLCVAIDRLAAGEVASVVSAGNSGAILAAALLRLGRISGVDRPAILTSFPSERGRTVVLDAGANVDCRPINLVQFAVMGSVFAAQEHGCARPRVALLSNGSEPSKGTELTRAALRLLEQHPSPSFELVGYLEPGELFRGVADVVVTDGWTGNIVLKLAEGAMATWPRLLRQALHRGGSLGARRTGLRQPVRADGLRQRPTSLVLRSALARVREQVDPDAHGGAPLIGVDGTVIICHGAAGPEAIYNALRLAQRSAERGLTPALHRAIADHASLFEAARAKPIGPDGPTKP